MSLSRGLSVICRHCRPVHGCGALCEEEREHDESNTPELPRRLRKWRQPPDKPRALCLLHLHFYGKSSLSASFLSYVTPFPPFSRVQQSYYFERDDVALPGFAKYFRKSASEELEHAQTFMKYQNDRGGRIVLRDITKPAKDEWGNGLEAMHTALELEKTVNQALLDLRKLAATHDDSHVSLLLFPHSLLLSFHTFLWHGCPPCLLPLSFHVWSLLLPPSPLSHSLLYPLTPSLPPSPLPPSSQPPSLSPLNLPPPARRFPRGEFPYRASRGHQAVGRLRNPTQEDWPWSWRVPL